jgi:hypothetical protein
VVHRLSPSGRFIASERLRWLAGDPNDELLEESYALGALWFPGLQTTPDPATKLAEVVPFAYEAQPDLYVATRAAITRVQGDPSGVTPPSGDDDIVIQLQRFKVDGAEQNDVGDPVSFGPAEFVTKFLDVNAPIPQGEFLFVRATYPANWVMGNQDPGFTLTLEVS